MNNNARQEMAGCLSLSALSKHMPQASIWLELTFVACVLMSATVKDALSSTEDLIAGKALYATETCQNQHKANHQNQSSTTFPSHLASEIRVQFISLHHLLMDLYTMTAPLKNNFLIFRYFNLKHWFHTFPTYEILCQSIDTVNVHFQHAYMSVHLYQKDQRNLC